MNGWHFFMQIIADSSQPLGHVGGVGQTGQVARLDLIDTALNRFRRLLVGLSEKNAFSDSVQYNLNPPAFTRLSFDFSQTRHAFSPCPMIGFFIVSVIVIPCKELRKRESCCF